jgi:ABC-2 type transport system ATP-binding protein
VISLQAVRAKGVARKGQVTAELRGVSLELSAGVTVIVGARVSGGALILDLVSGRVRAASGRVTVLGLPAGADALARDVAYVPLAAELPPGLTVMESLRMSLAMRAKEPRSAEEALERLGVSALATRRTDTLTPGEHRVVLLSMALATQARVVLMEEPCNWFDPRAMEKILEALRSIASEGSAVVLATQSAVDATRIGGRHLRALGGILEEGLPEPAFVGVRLTTERRQALLAALSELPADMAVVASEHDITISGRNPREVVTRVGRLIAHGDFNVTSFEKVTSVELPTTSTPTSTPTST